MDSFLQDIRYAWRTLAKNPGFTLVAVLTLMLGIGANTAIFSIVHEVLLKPLPYRDSDRLVRVYSSNPQRGLDTFPVRPVDWVVWQQQSKSFEEVGLTRPSQFTLTGRGNPEQLLLYRFSPNFFSMLGVKPVLGRTFTEAEDKPGSDRVVVLSHAYWQRKFGGDPNIVGQSVTLNGERFEIIGVMGPGVSHPGPSIQGWLPLAVSPEMWQNPRVRFLRIVARLKPGVTIAQAQAELASIAQAQAQQDPSRAGWTAAVHDLRSSYMGDARKPLLALLGAVGFILLIACVNVANLLMARSTARQREFAVRNALGARRGRIVRQLLTESLLLALIGGILGLLLAGWTANAFVALFPTDISNLDLPKVEHVPISTPVILFSFGITLLTSILFGLLPAWQGSRTGVSGTLKEGERGLTGRGRSRWQRALVVGELALAFVLLVGAGLLLRSFQQVQRTDIGFEADRILGLSMELGPRFDTPEKQRAYVDQVVQRLRTLPGVESVGVTNFLPLTGWSAFQPFVIEGRPQPRPEDTPLPMYFVATPEYFPSMGISVLRGRNFSAVDVAGAPGVVMINQAAARKWFGDEDPVGQRIAMGSAEQLERAEIIGVVANVKHFGQEEQSEPSLYRPFAQAPFGFVGFAIRTSGDPNSLLRSAEHEVWQVNPEQAIMRTLALGEAARQSNALRRGSTIVIAGLALLGLLLASIGIYGVLSFAVTQRTHEIGVRMAIGAQQQQVLGMVMRDALILAGVGLALGLIGAFAASRLLRSLLYEVTAGDPLTYIGIIAMLALTAAAAAFFPARRASRVDPMVALRYE